MICSNARPPSSPAASVGSHCGVLGDLALVPVAAPDDLRQAVAGMTAKITSRIREGGNGALGRLILVAVLGS